MFLVFTLNGSPMLEGYTAAIAHGLGQSCITVTGHCVWGCFTPPASEAYSEGEDVTKAGGPGLTPGTLLDINTLFLDPHSVGQTLFVTTAILELM